MGELKTFIETAKKSKNEGMNTLANTRQIMLDKIVPLPEPTYDRPFRFHFPAPTKLKHDLVNIIDMNFGWDPNKPENLLLDTINLWDLLEVEENDYKSEDSNEEEEEEKEGKQEKKKMKAIRRRKRKRKRKMKMKMKVIKRKKKRKMKIKMKVIGKRRRKRKMKMKMKVIG